MTNFSIFNLSLDQTDSHDKGGTRLLHLARQQLLTINVHSPRAARLICKMVPACCPFERDIQVLGRTLFHIPPFCTLNPFYDQLVELRFRALSYLADECGEEITS